jgi:hypothetical protein
MTAKQSATSSEARPLLRCAEPAPFLEPEIVEDDTTWAERCEHWLGESQKQRRGRELRERSKQPLILCGHGVLLRVEGAALTIRNGFTHYPQKQESYRFFKGELTIPPRIIMLDGSGSISCDVLAWLSEQVTPSFTRSETHLPTVATSSSRVLSVRTSGAGPLKIEIVSPRSSVFPSISDTSDPSKRSACTRIWCEVR